MWAGVPDLRGCAVTFSHAATGTTKMRVKMTRYDLNRKPVTGVTREYLVMNHRTEGRRRAEQEEFGKNSDSGSLVINAEGNVCGLYYGNVGGRGGSAWKHGAGYDDDGLGRWY